jgi:hypothetical protein
MQNGRSGNFRNFPKSTGNYIVKVTLRLARALRNVCFVVLLIFLPLFLRGCVARPASTYPGSHFNQGKNAAWVGIEWVNEIHSDDETKTLANDLKQHQISHAFVYVSYLAANGDFNATYAHAERFVKIFRQTQPSIKILAWYGLPLNYVDLSNKRVRGKITAFSADLVNRFGFDGVQLDPEPIGDGDSNVLTLLEETRQVLPHDAILSIATRTIWPIFPDMAASRLGPVFWSHTYYRQIASRVNQVAIMTYDSGLTSPMLYRLWTRFQIIQTSQALADTSVELFIGLPVSEEESATHHVAAENVVSGLQGVIDGLNDDETHAVAVTGVALYPYWEMDITKWAIYDALWLGKQP